MTSTEPKIVVIGGGTGSFTLLSALKNHTKQLTALVNMADDGGSTGLLRDELGVLPPGDIRQCLVALSTASDELRELFNYRFPKGTFGGHSFGNLLLSAVESMTDDFSDAVRIAGDVLRIRGRVMPVTLDDCQLVLQDGGHKIKGQYDITYTERHLNGRPQLSLEPQAALNPLAREAIAEADLIILSPGNLYGSLAPALLVDGIAEALKNSPAQLVFVCNLVNKPQLTRDFAVHDYASEIERFIGKDALDYVLYNNDEPEPELLNTYALDEEFPVRVDLSALEKAHYKTIAGQFLSRAPQQGDANDTLIKRSLIRHDGEAVAEALLKLL